MPQTQLPPTPASSTDIRGKEKLLALAPALALPPAAYTEPEDRTASSTPSSHAGSDSSYHPASPALSPPKTQKKSVVATTQARAVKGDDGFALPPPPTRNRKIIQVKPKGSPVEELVSGDVEVPAASSSTKPVAGKGKRGKDGNTTAAGRKIARKTAHSLIERRRRSKMNEEFGVLKDMIPACRGQEMHKLAILQASIDYLRYLERCITDLKAANEEGRQTTSPPAPTHDVHMDGQTQRDNETMDHDSDSDEAMSDDGDDANETHDNNHKSGADTPNTLEPISSRNSLPSLASLPSISHFTTASTSTISPSIMPTTSSSLGYNQTHRHYSISSASQASFSPYIHSAHTSPFFGPSYSGHPNDLPAAFSLTSPALKAQDAHHSFRLGSVSSNGQIQHLALSTGGNNNSNNNDAEARRQQEVQREQDLDHEATAALLMLNSDRREWKDKNGRGMSVRDLIS